ncbi:MAG: dienelactone hydrolase family protein [Myxococcales bacterium]|nr:dienelactone hydrolase family protein [Myxococcales bacterium]
MRMSLCLSLFTAVLLLPFAVSRAQDNEYVDSMSEEHAGEEPTSNPMSEVAPESPITSGDVVYATVAGQPITGYLASPTVEDGAPRPPALLVIHEWWGLNDNVRAMSDRLAGLGYTALAVDLYSGNVAETPEQAREYMQAAMADPEAARDNLSQALDFLNDGAQPRRIGSIGWCFGGGWSLNASIMFPDQIDATVIYYGHLETDPASLAPLSSPVLGIFGGADESISQTSIQTFEAALNEMGIPVEIHVFDGAGHAFANPSGSHYVEGAAEQAWDLTEAFLRANLQGME